jgi:hypothetical protein
MYLKKDRMLLRLLLIMILLLDVAATTPGWSQPMNVAPLRGGPPFNFNVLPPLPATGFYAWCETPHGLCVVQGSAPISPGSVCHCAEFEGRTG